MTWPACATPHWPWPPPAGTVRYGGRVHEQPEHRLPVRPWPLRVGHDGYLPERLQAKRGRNRRLQQRALALALVLEGTGRTEQAARLRSQ